MSAIPHSLPQPSVNEPDWTARMLQRLDPRRSLATAIGWLTIALGLGLALAASQWTGSIVKHTLLEQHSLRLASTADQIAAEIDLAMSLRLQSLEMAAAMLGPEFHRVQTDRLAEVLNQVRKSFPDFLWIGAADPDGQIVAATSENVVGTNVHNYAWESRGLIVSWVEEGLDLSTPRYLATGEGQHFLNLTAPIRSPKGAVLGVVAARLNWSWLEDLAHEVDKGMRQGTPEQWLLIDRDNIIRIGPPELIGKFWPHEAPPLDNLHKPSLLRTNDIPERISLHLRPGTGPIMVSSAQQQDMDSLQKLGWRVVVMQPVVRLNRQLLSIEWEIGSVLLLIAGIASFLSVLIGKRLTRRIRTMAKSADAIASGEATHIEAPPGSDEASRLGKALERLLQTLEAERDGLKQLNLELDQRVADRTREIRRLAEDSRYSAVVRERLKIARDLHDTLAHSMMAMLTEIRLLKKLAQQRPEELREELERAEAAAHQGLKEAREAITSIRYNPARDIGLGEALRELVSQFSARSGIACNFELSPDLATYADARAETLYRIAEEALRNIERHAGAHQVNVSLLAEDEGRALKLSIVDDGIGFDAQQRYPGHYGLVGLYEIADLAGARFNINSSPGQGTCLTLQLRIQYDHREA